MEIVPLCTTGMLAAAALMVATLTAPRSLSGWGVSADAGCDSGMKKDAGKDETRG